MQFEVIPAASKASSYHSRAVHHAAEAYSHCYVSYVYMSYIQKRDSARTARVHNDVAADEEAQRRLNLRERGHVSGEPREQRGFSHYSKPDLACSQ